MIKWGCFFWAGSDLKFRFYLHLLLLEDATSHAFSICKPTCSLCYIYYTKDLWKYLYQWLLVISKMMMKGTAVSKLLLSGSCYCPSSESKLSWAANSCLHAKGGGMEFKSLHLLKTPFPMSKNALSWSSSASLGKVSHVISPKQSISKTLDLLDAYEDEYGGMVIDPECLPSSANAFVLILRASITHWKIKGKKGIWLKILVELADLVPVAIKEGFIYHHAEPGYVMLTYWIPDEPCILPASATHQVGIAAFVINQKREVLVVKEKQCPCRCSGIWKLPTGFVNKSEELFMGVVREVREETGIDTAFVEVTAFRHAHLVAFEKSDLLFICMLRPLSFDISIDESEIEAAKVTTSWVIEQKIAPRKPIFHLQRKGCNPNI